MGWLKKAWKKARKWKVKIPKIGLKKVKKALKKFRIPIKGISIAGFGVQFGTAKGIKGKTKTTIAKVVTPEGKVLTTAEKPSIFASPLFLIGGLAIAAFFVLPKIKKG